MEKIIKETLMMMIIIMITDGIRRKQNSVILISFTVIKELNSNMY